MEFRAALFWGMEKKKDSTARFKGPPPIPRNTEISPRSSPTEKTAGEALTDKVYFSKGKEKYMNTANVINKSMVLWMNFTFEAGDEAVSNSNIFFPNNPPSMLPAARIELSLMLTFCFSLKLFPRDTTAMENTVELLRKLMEAAFMEVVKSRMGLISTPPPIPLTAPAIDVNMVKMK